MTRRDFSKDRSRQAIAGRGYEPIDGGYIATGPRRPHVSKAELRNDLDKALSADPMVTKIIKCQCGHQGKVRIPLSRRDGPFTCRCGRKTR